MATHLTPSVSLPSTTTLNLVTADLWDDAPQSAVANFEGHPAAYALDRGRPGSEASADFLRRNKGNRVSVTVDFETMELVSALVRRTVPRGLRYLARFRALPFGTSDGRLCILAGTRHVSRAGAVTDAAARIKA